jgi:hypothetical protein
MKIQANNIAKFLLHVSIIVFVISLTQNTYCTSSGSCEDSPGWLVLLIGTVGVIFGGACLSWLANPFIIFSWIFFKKIKYSFIFSLLAVIDSASFLLFSKIISDEAGNYSEIIHHHTGYWLWLSSMFVMLMGNIIRLLNKNKIS